MMSHDNVPSYGGDCSCKGAGLASNVSVCKLVCLFVCLYVCLSLIWISLCYCSGLLKFSWEPRPL